MYITGKTVIIKLPMILEKLKDCIGETVSVWAGVTAERKFFSTSICVCGKLEMHNYEQQFRVVVNDGNYTYFTAKDVVEVLRHYTSFKDGAKVLIKLNVEQTRLMSDENDVSKLGGNYISA